MARLAPRFSMALFLPVKPSADKPVRGRVTPYGFTLKKVVWYRNSFQTQASGELLDEPKGTRISIAFGLPSAIQLLVILWLVAALAYGAWSRHWSIVAVAGGLIALWSGLTAGILPGCVLVLWGWLDDAGLLDTGRLGGTNRERWSGLKALVPALAAPFGLAAALHSEVLLPVVAMVAISLALVIEAGRRPRPA